MPKSRKVDVDGRDVYTYLRPESPVEFSRFIGSLQDHEGFASALASAHGLMREEAAGLPPKVERQTRTWRGTPMTKGPHTRSDELFLAMFLPHGLYGKYAVLMPPTPYEWVIWRKALAALFDRRKDAEAGEWVRMFEPTPARQLIDLCWSCGSLAGSYDVRTLLGQLVDTVDGMSEHPLDVLTTHNAEQNQKRKDKKANPKDEQSAPAAGSSDEAPVPADHMLGELERRLVAAQGVLADAALERAEVGAAHNDAIVRLNHAVDVERLARDEAQEASSRYLAACAEEAAASAALKAERARLSSERPWPSKPVVPPKDSPVLPGVPAVPCPNAGDVPGTAAWQSDFIGQPMGVPVQQQLPIQR